MQFFSLAVCHRSGCNCIRFALFHLLIDLAIFILFFCKHHRRTNVGNWRRCIQYQLVSLSKWHAKIHHFDYVTFVWSATILRSGFNTMHIGDFRTCKYSIYFSMRYSFSFQLTSFCSFSDRLAHITSSFEAYPRGKENGKLPRLYDLKWLWLTNDFGKKAFNNIAHRHE